MPIFYHSQHAFAQSMAQSKCQKSISKTLSTPQFRLNPLPADLVWIATAL
jgi:hypothetical protein